MLMKSSFLWHNTEYHSALLCHKLIKNMMAVWIQLRLIDFTRTVDFVQYLTSVNKET